MRRSPVMSIGPNPVVRAGRYLQGQGHATERTRSGLGASVRRPAGVDGRVPDRGAALLAPADGRRRVRLERRAAGAAGAGERTWLRPWLPPGMRLLVDYLPFIALLLALYTTGGGVLLRGGPAGHAGRQHGDAGAGHGDGGGDGDHRRLDGADPPAAACQRASPAQGASGAVPDRAGRQRVGRADAARQSAALSRAAARRAVLLAGPPSAGAAAGGSRPAAGGVLSDRPPSGGGRAAGAAAGAVPRPRLAAIWR